MQREVVDALPRCGLLGALFLPDKDLAVIASRCEDVAVLGMGPCNTPDGSLVSAKDQLLPSLRLSLKISASSQTDGTALFHLRFPLHAPYLSLPGNRFHLARRTL